MLEAVPAHQEHQEKHGGLFGGALTDEALDSSRKVLQGSRGNKNATVGLQQWFSPPEAARLIHAVVGPSNAVLDPTAGSGALLEPFAEGSRYGIEIDRDHALDSGYLSVPGDAQRVVPMMRAAGLKWPAVVLNPPFGLLWRDPAHAKGEVSSTLLAFLWAVDLLAPFGQGAVISGRDRLFREVLPREEAKGVYAVVEVDGPLFDSSVAIPCAIAFFVKPEDLREGSSHDLGPERFAARKDELIGLSGLVREARMRSVRHTSAYVADARAHREGFVAVAQENARRRSVEAGKRKERLYDVALRGQKISALPSAYARLALQKADGNALREVQLLHGQHVRYFGQNGRAWRQLADLEGRGLITLDPALRGSAEQVMEEALLVSTPLFPVRPQMRLGWLADLDRIPCIKDDPARGFVAGEEYPLRTASKVETRKEERVVEKKNGDPELRRFEIERRLLEVRIGDHSFDEGPENILYLTEHFEMPDPGCVATRYPEQVARNLAVIEEIEAEVRENYARYMRRQGKHDFEPFSYKGFQKDHMSRLLTKRRGMLAHDPGLGKSLMSMTLAEATVRMGAKNQVLFGAPQDLLDQWQAYAEMFFGRRFEVIRTPVEARRVGQRVRAGEEGWWITHYEALSLIGRKKELLPERPLDHRVALAQRLFDYKYEKRRRAGLDPAAELGRLRPTGPTTADACPECRADTVYGWNGEVCSRCGYVHRKLLVKPAYSHLTTAFRDGVTVIDEISEIRGDDSLRSKSVRALARGPHKYGLTGTPLSNYISDAFYGLWWCLGGSSAAFPYAYGAEGKRAFENDFCVAEYTMGRESDREEHLRKRRKLLPRITNVSQFWRLAQPGISRCRKEQTGEPLVPKTYHPIRVPMGVKQREMHAFWMQNFAAYFIDRNPDHPLVKLGLVDRWQASLGQRWRLEHAATLPAADAPTREWPQAIASLGEVSNWTPANLKALEVAYAHAAKEEKVLIGSDLILTGRFIADELVKKGVRAVHITEERAGKVGTKNPRQRAREVAEFTRGDAQVLCSGIAAMKLGHNLDCASTVLISGLPESYMALIQFLERVHRITSKKPVSVYVILPRRSLAETKWDLLREKGGTSDLAFDGELHVQPEVPVDWHEVLGEMKRRGIGATGEEVLEADVEAEWAKVAPLAFIAPKAKSALRVRPRTEGALALADMPGPEEYVQATLF